MPCWTSRPTTGEIYITEAQLPELAADLIHLARLPEEGLRRLLASDTLL